MSTRRATKVETTNAISTEIQAQYAGWGYSPQEATELEAARETVLHEQRNGLLSIVRAGTALIEVKERIPHGEWGAYIEERLSMSADTVERLMGSAKVARTHPQLLELADRMRPTALYALARGKAATPAVVEAVIESYREGNEEITADKVRDTAEIVNPPKATKEPKLPFKPIDEIMASDEMDRLAVLVSQVLRRGTSLGISYDKVLKSPLFRKWLKTDRAKGVLSLAAYFYALDYSVGGPDAIETIDGDGDGEDAPLFGDER